MTMLVSQPSILSAGGMLKIAYTGTAQHIGTMITAVDTRPT